MTFSDEKSRLRLELKARRAALGDAERVSASLVLCDKLVVFLQERVTPSIGVYLAQPTEISLDPFIGKLLEAGCVVSAPRLDVEKGEMEFVRLRTLQEIRSGPWKLREPIGDEVVIPTCVLVPGVGFDARGYRLGMGGGWYDRTLSPDMTRVGVCFDCQIVPEIPVEEHDYRMNWVFSERRTLGPF